MIVAASLLTYATLVAFAGQVVLARLTRTGATPRLGIVAWYAAALSASASWVIGAMAVGHPDPLHELAHLLTSSVTAVHEVTRLHDVTAVPAASWLRLSGAAVAAAIVVRAACCLTVDLTRARRRRRRHLQKLGLVARSLPGRDVLVVEHGTPLAYCVPGRSRAVVVTRGALRALSDEQLDAVLEHERAHLVGRHHLALAPIRALARALPGIPLLVRAAAEVSRLLEMSADDAAARQHGRAAVAGALRSLSHVATPAWTLAAAGGSAEERIARLSSGQVRRSRADGRLVTALLLLIVGPLASVALPILIAATSAG